MVENNSNGASGGAQSAPDVPSSAEGAGPSLKDFLDFDPFEPSSEGKAPAPSDEPVDGAAGDALPPKGNSQQVQPPTSAPADDPVLRELSRINQTLAESRQQQQYYPPQQPTPQGATPPRFNLEIPQQILKAVIHSEDPEERAMGLAALVNGLANTLYNDISSEFRNSQQQAIPGSAANALAA